MANQKISTYLTEVLALIPNDRLDVSKEISPGVFDTQFIKYSTLLTELNADLTVQNFANTDLILTGNRIHNAGVNDLTIRSTGDANLLKLETTNDRVGIGTATPTEKLEVTGNILVPNTSDFFAVGTAPITNIPTISGVYARISSDANSQSHAFGVPTNSNFGFVVCEQGTTPTGVNKLMSVRDDSGLGHVLELHRSTGGGVAFAQFSELDESYVDIGGTASTDRFRIQNSASSFLFNVEGTGNVGIGTGTPTEKLDVVGNIANGLTDLIATGTVPTTSIPTNSGFYGNSGANVNTFQHVFGIRDNNINGFCIAVENTTPTVEDKIFQVGRTGGNTEVRVMDAVSDAGGGTIVLSTNSGETVFNNAGNDVNFRIEGDTDANLFKIDAGLNNVGFGVSAPTEKVDVNGSVNTNAPYKTNGNSGVASFTGAVTSITIENGIVTAIS